MQAVRPTNVDDDNAIQYAFDVVNKEFCLSRPDLYTWIPDATTSYPCPEGLSCESGTCKFKENACISASTLPYYDCQRKTVPCNVSDTCDVCDYAIVPTHKIVGPYTTTPLPSGCYPGDYRTPESGNLCQPPAVEHPVYTIDRRDTGPTPVTCTSDVDCFVYGAGGMCGAQGVCVNDEAPYLEWRDQVELYSGYQSKNVCVQTDPSARRWCEMPWTRSGSQPDDLTTDLQTRVTKAWKTKARPPFYYNSRDGKCYVTKSYCTKSAKNGGMSAGYGNSWSSSLFGDVCTSSTNNEINRGSDCCTAAYETPFQFFLGRTLVTDLRELVKNPGSFENYEAMGNNFKIIGETINTGLQKGGTGMIDMVCDPRLKTGLRILLNNILPGVNIYEWTWSARATQLYNVQGRATGVITTEMPAPFVFLDARTGYNVLRLPVTHPVVRFSSNTSY